MSELAAVGSGGPVLGARRDTEPPGVGLSQHIQTLRQSGSLEDCRRLVRIVPKAEDHSRYAKATFRKDRRLNIRLSSNDLEAIQKAFAEGLPY
jgi:predicted DNA binding CopG/RHH family protein